MANNKTSVEQYINELKDITDKMRSDITLDETIKLYKKGKEIADKATQLLNGYKQEIEILCSERHNDTNE